MRLLIVGDIGIIFTYEYITEVASKFPGCSIDVLSFAPRLEKNAEREKKLEEIGCRIFYQPEYKLFKSNKLFHVFIRIAERFRYKLCKDYDVINIHFPGVDSYLVSRYAKKDTRIVTSIYGSDVLRASRRSLKSIGKLLKKSNAVTVASSYVKDKVSEVFSKQFDDKVRIIRYGSKAAEYMSGVISKYTREQCKEHFGFPKDKISVLCGYNGSRSQRHISIIEELEKLPEMYRERLYLVLQCSYGLDELYKNQLTERLDRSCLNGEIVTEFMQGETLAKFRNSIDVFLNLQPTDVLSATMIEELEAGALVVKGDWLCYPDLEQENIFMHSIKDMEELPLKMQSMISDFDTMYSQALRNKGVWTILSWQSQFDKWQQIILEK